MKDATPARVRAELKRRKLPYEIVKQEGFWYVFGPENTTELWYQTCLMTPTFHGRPASYWVDVIEGMAESKGR
jgi:hypothetical protein